MSQRCESIGTVEQILASYYQGYFPLYDWFGRFYWERPALRAMIVLDAAAAARAARMQRRAGRGFTFAQNTSFEKVLTCLSDPKIKPFTWVRPQVREIYRRLHQGGFVHTVEAFNQRGALAGAVLGIMLPGVLIAETMFLIEPEASKACLCQLVRDLYSRGFAFIDVQTPHEPPPPPPGAPRVTVRRPATPHPCVRLGETCCNIQEFIAAMHSAIAREVGPSLDPYIATVPQIAAAYRAFGQRRTDPHPWTQLREEVQTLLRTNHAAARALAVVGPSYPLEFTASLIMGY